MKLRKLQLESGCWRYCIGRSNAVLFPPDGSRKLVVPLNTLTGRSWHILERGQWKKTSDGMIGPGDVRRYLESNELHKMSDPRRVSV